MLPFNPSRDVFFFLWHCLQDQGRVFSIGRIKRMLPGEFGSFDNNVTSEGIYIIDIYIYAIFEHRRIFNCKSFCPFLIKGQRYDFE